MSASIQTSSELQAFAARYADEFQQDITKYDLLRKVAMGLIAAGITLGAGLWYWLSLTEDGGPVRFSSFAFLETTAFMLLFGGSALFGGLHAFSAYVRRSTKRKMFPALAQSMRWQYTPGASAHLPLSLFTRYDILPDSFDWSKTQNHLVGRIDDVAFMAFDLSLTRRGRKNRKQTVFNGTVLAYQFPNKFAAKTILLEDKGWFNRGKIKVEDRTGWHTFSFPTSSAKAETLDRVIIADPIFEKKFEAYSSDQVEARVLLTPDFIEKLVALEGSIYGKNLRCAFSGNKLLISIEEPTLKNPAKLFATISADFLVQSLMQEAETILDIARSVAGRKNSFKRTSKRRIAPRSVKPTAA